MLENFTEGYLEFDLDDSQEPKIGNIYYLFYGNQLMYIGKTVDMESRILSHKKDKYFDKVLYKECSSEEMSDLEKSEIRKYFPIYNSQFINKEDWQSPDCLFYLEFHDMYIIRGEGHILKRNTYIKNDILLVLDVNSYYIRSRKIDLTNKVKFKSQDHYLGSTKGLSIEYDADNHTIKVNQPEKNIERTKMKNAWKNKKDLKIPDNYRFPVGKYKGRSYSEVKDDNYKKWFYKEVYLNDPKVR